MKSALLVLGLAACISEPLKMEEMPCPPGGTQLTYETFGQRFLDEHCNLCHDTSKNGAPTTFKFDSLEATRSHAARIFLRAAGPNTTMPPGPEDPPAEQRDQLAEWLACGAP